MAERDVAREYWALVAVTALFGVLTVVALAVDGVGGFVDAITFNWASLQIYVDLVIAILVFCVWMHRDARAEGRNPWPFIAASFVVGMFGPLAYPLTRPRR